MKRLVLCAAAAAALFAVPAVASAQPMHRHHRYTHQGMRHSHSHAARSANHYTGYHGGDTRQGTAAVDQLNAQSLERARGGAQ